MRSQLTRSRPRHHKKRSTRRKQKQRGGAVFPLNKCLELGISFCQESSNYDSCKANVQTICKTAEEEYNKGGKKYNTDELISALLKRKLSAGNNNSPSPEYKECVDKETKRCNSLATPAMRFQCHNNIKNKCAGL